MSAPKMKSSQSNSAENSPDTSNKLNIGPSMVKSSSYTLESSARKYRKNRSKSTADSDDEEDIPAPSMSKSVSYNEAHTQATPQPAMSKSQSFASDGHKKKKSKKKGKKRRRRNKAQTNKFLTAVNVGQTVKLSKHRIGFVRYKGKVKFGIGIWYGLEIYDSLTKTRHNGTVFGKRYFNCPRSKGIFVKRDVITEIIPAQKLKKALKTLEQRQIKEKKLRDNHKKTQKQSKNVSKGTAVNNGKYAQGKSSILAIYQQEFYGNNKLMVALETEQKESADGVGEDRIKKDFKRFQRLSFMAQNNKDILSINRKDMAMDVIMDEKSDEDPHKGIDIDAEAWDSKERPIIELLDDINDENDLDLCGVRLFYEFSQYFTAYEYVFNKGLLIKSIDVDSKQGRALVLECGMQGDNGWYITQINDENIKKYSQESVHEILEKVVPDIGYDIVLRKLGGASSKFKI